MGSVQALSWLQTPSPNHWYFPSLGTGWQAGGGGGGASFYVNKTQSLDSMNLPAQDGHGHFSVELIMERNLLPTGFILWRRKFWRYNICSLLNRCYFLFLFFFPRWVEYQVNDVFSSSKLISQILGEKNHGINRDEYFWFLHFIFLLWRSWNRTTDFPET